MTGVRVQFGMMFGRTSHSATFPVVFAASSDRAMNQPFCARLRPSRSWRSPETAWMVMRRSESSGARTTVLPVAIGSASTYSLRPRSSKVLYPSNWRIFVSADLVFVVPIG